MVRPITQKRKLKTLDSEGLNHLLKVTKLVSWQSLDSKPGPAGCQSAVHSRILGCLLLAKKGQEAGWQSSGPTPGLMTVFGKIQAGGMNIRSLSWGGERKVPSHHWVSRTRVGNSGSALQPRRSGQVGSGDRSLGLLRQVLDSPNVRPRVSFGSIYFFYFFYCGTTDV